MEQWKRAVTFMVEDVHRQIEELRELTIPEKKVLETALQAETSSPRLPQKTRLYDFVNALTSSAKQATPSRRLELESVAGQMLVRHVGTSP